MRISEARRRKIAELAAEIRRLHGLIGRPVQIMEVCGTHSHSVGRWGLRQLLPEGLRLISGPGCPVCVTTPGQLEAAAEIVRRGCVVASFGDMMRVPLPSGGSLAELRAEGREVHVVYSPAEALELAKRLEPRRVCFIAVGFETTAPAVAAVVAQAAAEGVENFCILSLHKLIPPAMEALLELGETRIDGFLCPGHVSTVIGWRAYDSIARRWGIPCVVAGFEPEDILLGICMILRQMAEGRAEAENAYTRAVRAEGNARARGLMEAVFEACDAAWRGLGRIAGSGLRLREEYADFDAWRIYGVEEADIPEPAGCRCGEVLRGLITPEECQLFGKACTPRHPVGPCMVSSEGTCAAAYRYGRAPAEGAEARCGAEEIRCRK